METSRIAIMIPRFSRYGGVEGIAYRLCETLVSRGHIVHVICARQEVEAPSGVTVVSVGRVGGLRSLKMLWFLFFAEFVRRKGDYDLSISLGKTWNQDIARTGGGALQAFWRRSIQAWPKGPVRTWKVFTRLLSPANWLTLLIEKRMFTQTPHIVAISETVRKWILEVYPHLENQKNKAKQKLHTIYNNPDLSMYAPATEDMKMQAREQFNILPNTFALGLATTNFLLKGVAPLICSLEKLPSDVHLYVAGGRDNSSYIKLAQKLSVENRVHFCGKVTNMKGFYHSLDMFILPTFYDTLGNVVLEAMASGIKTLCSNRAGAQDFLPPDQIICDPSNSEEIAEKIITLRAKKTLVPLHVKGGGIEDLADLAERVLLEKKADHNNREE